LNQNKIKKISPQKNTKGYAESLLGGWDVNCYIFKRIDTIDDSLINFKFNEKDAKELLNIIKRTKIIRNGGKPEEGDFLPKGFENEESKGFNDYDFLRYVLYRYRYNIYPKFHIIEDYPPCVQIEPTSICNYRCVMCYQADKSFSNKSEGFMGYMKFDLFKKAIDELHGNVEAITLASRGEPTLHPRFDEMLRYVSNKFLGFKVNTNASLMNERLAHLLLESNINTLVFSVDAADKNTYEQIRVNGKFDSVLKNIETFSEIKEKYYPNNNMQTKISGVKISDSKQSMSEMASVWSGLVDDVAFVNYNPWESAYTNSDNSLSEPCSDLWRRTFLWWDGKINPCDYDYKSTLFRNKIPNFSDTSISEIWNSDAYDELRYKHLNSSRNSVEPCRRCVKI